MILRFWRWLWGPPRALSSLRCICGHMRCHHSRGENGCYETSFFSTVCSCQRFISELNEIDDLERLGKL